jgi:REP element-mobilizing transposase RayT
MKYELQKHYRRSLRLKEYDYSQIGAYYITICTHNRECLFGEIVDSEMLVNDIGETIKKWWSQLENKFKDIKLDELIIMPNHIHGIIIIVGADLCVCPETGEHIGSPLPKIVQWFKTMTTNEYISGVKQNRFKPFNSGEHTGSPLLWQRNYYEHIIRNEDELSKVREYIVNNPLKWQFDKENPTNIKGNRW